MWIEMVLLDSGKIKQFCIKVIGVTSEQFKDQNIHKQITKRPLIQQMLSVILFHLEVCLYGEFIYSEVLKYLRIAVIVGGILTHQ